MCIRDRFNEFAIVANVGDEGSHRDYIVDCPPDFRHLNRHLAKDAAHLPAEITGERSPPLLFRRQKTGEPYGAPAFGYDRGRIGSRFLKIRRVLSSCHFGQLN